MSHLKHAMCLTEHTAIYGSTDYTILCLKTNDFYQGLLDVRIGLNLLRYS